jgi:hypothetical protein
MLWEALAVGGNQRAEAINRFIKMDSQFVNFIPIPDVDPQGKVAIGQADHRQTKLIQPLLNRTGKKIRSGHTSRKDQEADAQ